MKTGMIGVLVLGLLLALGQDATAQPVIAPGQVVVFDQADQALSDVSPCDGYNAICETDANAQTGALGVRAHLSAGAFTSKHVQVTLLNGFQIAGQMQPERLIRATISGVVSYAGYENIGGTLGETRALFSIKVRLRDVTANNKTVVEQQIAYEECATGSLPGGACLRWPQGSPVFNLTVNLTRGHLYAFDVIARCENVIEIGAGVVTCSFKRLSGAPSDGVHRHPVRLEVERDLAEELDALKKEIDTLKKAFEAHRHHFLTGRGAGHNDVPASTTTPLK